MGCGAQNLCHVLRSPFAWFVVSMMVIQVSERQRVGERSTMLCTSMNLTTNVVNLFGRRCCSATEPAITPFYSAESFLFGTSLYRGKDWKIDPFIIFHCEVAFKGYVKFIVNNTLCIFIISRIHREIARATVNQRVTS